MAADSSGVDDPFAEDADSAIAAGQAQAAAIAERKAAADALADRARTTARHAKAQRASHARSAATIQARRAGVQPLHTPVRAASQAMALARAMADPKRHDRGLSVRRVRRATAPSSTGRHALYEFCAAVVASQICRSAVFAHCTLMFVWVYCFALMSAVAPADRGLR